VTPFDQLFFALIKEHDLAKAEAIIAAHPTVLQEDGQGIALLDSAAHDGKIPVIALLVKHGIDVNSTPAMIPMFDGPINNAAMNGHSEAVLWFIEHGAIINPVYQGHRYCMALAAACIWGHLKCAEVLVDHGADINACWAGKNPLSLAEESGHKAIFDYLRSKGGKLPEELGSGKLKAKPAPPDRKRKKKS
jgi:ankyrin repeat protein